MESTDFLRKSLVVKYQVVLKTTEICAEAFESLVCLNVSATILLSATNFHDKILSCFRNIKFLLSASTWEVFKTPFV